MIEINKIYNENCLETMAKMPDCFIDLTVTSPPYDNLREYKGYSFDFESIAKELYRVTKVGGVVVWVVGDATIKGSETGTSFKQALFFKECGFNLHDTMIWFKSVVMPTNSNRYDPSFEYMFVMSKGKTNVFNPIKKTNINAGKYKREAIKQDRSSLSENSNSKSISGKEIKYKEEGTLPYVWICATGLHGSTSDKIAFQHPAIFPEKLVYDHILSWSNPDDLVYDCFMGSGTTAKVSIITKRNYIGSEISDEYCEIIRKRLMKEQNTLL